MATLFLKDETVHNIIDEWVTEAQWYKHCDIKPHYLERTCNELIDKMLDRIETIEA